MLRCLEDFPIDYFDTYQFKCLGVDAYVGVSCHSASDSLIEREFVLTQFLGAALLCVRRTGSENGQRIASFAQLVS